jgi:hypothetical protein
MIKNKTIQWLLAGDVSIQYQVYRDLLDTERNDLRDRIEQEGWGKRFLSLRKEDGHWGQGFYQTKWVSTHYTLLDLMNLGISPACKPIKDTLRLILTERKSDDGGINPAKTISQSDVCINGMALDYFTYFKMPEKNLESIVDFIISQQMPDGGFNCMLNRSGARHSSLHSTISLLEGIAGYRENKYTYRIDELTRIEQESREFILQHRLFKSDKTGLVIKKQFLNLSWPSRWYYDILRALDYFRNAGAEYDDRMQDAFEVILSKRTKEGVWKLQAHHPGKFHFHMEKVSQPSRWNTLRTLRVLKHYKIPFNN